MEKQNLLFYQIFVRNYSQSGTFNQIKENLDHLQDLGVDVIYFTPIHPIGIKRRKGTWGSPYAVRDYFAISPDLGTLDELKDLIQNIHKKGMKIILDMVFNHTAFDNPLQLTHPEYYYHRDGKFANKVGDWTDIIDLETAREDTQDYLLSVLKFWCSHGIDGFRFDVASLVHISFFKKAREALGRDVIFFAESVSPGSFNELRENNIPVASDRELSQYFDYLYNYNYFHDFIDFVEGKKPIETFINYINSDDIRTFRVNCLENHDVDRIASHVDNDTLLNIIEFSFMLKGDMFLYMNQEYGDKHKPNLFEKDPIKKINNTDLLSKIKEMVRFKKEFGDIEYQNIEIIDIDTFKLTVKSKNNTFIKEYKLRK